jgi:hypothetical protein
MLIAKKTPSKETSLYMYTNQQASQVQQPITHYTQRVRLFSPKLTVSMFMAQRRCSYGLHIFMHWKQNTFILLLFSALLF